MEKTKAHYPLNEIKALVKEGAVYITATAQRDAALLDYKIDDIIYVVENLEVGDLYKSMVSEQDDKLWQDVYHYPAEVVIYIKLQIREISGSGTCVIISFKER